MRQIPSLDGLRGIAIILVIAFHYFYFVPLFSFGWAGVDLFFVLSGYLITGRLLETMDRPDYFPFFYRNRILRIFPLYFTTLILFYICIHFLGKPSSQPQLVFYKTHWSSYFLFFINWTFIRYGVPGAGYLTHFWSLAIEEQFYLFWPLFIFCVRRTRHLSTILAFLILLVAVSRSICFYFYGQMDNPLFYLDNTFFRMDCLILGALLYVLHQTNKPLKAAPALFIGSGATLVIYAILTTSSIPWTPFLETIGYTVIAVFAACLIHFAVRYPKKSPVKLLNNKTLRFVGKISYGLYVIHFLIEEIFFSRLHDWYTSRFRDTGLAPDLFASVACLAITLALSALSYYYLETPFLRLKNRSTRPANGPLDTSSHSRY